MTNWVFNSDLCACVQPELSSDDSPAAPIELTLNDRYIIKEFLGRGGISKVFRALDSKTNEIVAIKMTRPEFAREEAAVKRLLQEAEIASRLVHENLVRVWGYGCDQSGLPYLVMEFVVGEELETFLRSAGKQMSQEEILKILMQVGQGLKCVHAHGIIHRDLKPGNIIIDHFEGQIKTVKIVDFGFSKVTRDSDSEKRLTQMDEAFGTPAYMSPEHCLGHDLDVRSDVYSFGCVMYELMTGRPPFMGKNILATIANQVKTVPTEPKKFNSEISDNLQNVVMRCLQKTPLLRYQSVSDLLDDLQKVKNGQTVELLRTIPKTQRPLSGNLRLPRASFKGKYLGLAAVFVATVFVLEMLGLSFFLWKKDEIFKSDKTGAQNNVAPKISTVEALTKPLPAKREVKIENDGKATGHPLASVAAQKLKPERRSTWNDLRNLLKHN